MAVTTSTADRLPDWGRRDLLMAGVYASSRPCGGARSYIARAGDRPNARRETGAGVKPDRMEGLPRVDGRSLDDGADGLDDFGRGRTDPEVLVADDVARGHRGIHDHHRGMGDGLVGTFIANAVGVKDRAVGVMQEGVVDALLVTERGDPFRVVGAHGPDLGTKVLELVDVVLQLTELGAAEGSPDAAVEHQHDRAIGDRLGQRVLLAVDRRQAEVGRGIADPNWRRDRSPGRKEKRHRRCGGSTFG